MPLSPQGHWKKRLYFTLFIASYIFGLIFKTRLVLEFISVLLYTSGWCFDNISALEFGCFCRVVAAALLLRFLLLQEPRQPRDAAKMLQYPNQQQPCISALTSMHSLFMCNPWTGCLATPSPHPLDCCTPPKLHVTQIGNCTLVESVTRRHLSAEIEESRDNIGCGASDTLAISFLSQEKHSIVRIRISPKTYHGAWIRNEVQVRV